MQKSQHENVQSAALGLEGHVVKHKLSHAAP